MDASMPNPEAEMNPRCTVDPEHECQAEDKLDEILAQLKRLTRAFPVDEFGEPDVVGHRRGHEAQIRAAEEQRAFWANLRADYTRRGIWAVFLVVSMLLAAGFVVRFKGFIVKLLEGPR